MNSPTDALHRRGLVGDLAQLHARRQRVLQARELVLERFAELEDVAAVLHRHRDADRVLAHEAHARRGRIGEAALHGGDVAEAERAIAGADREFADLLDRIELAGDAQVHAVGAGLEEAGRGHRVLFLQRLLHRRQRHAQRGELGVAQLDPDLLVLQADQVDLADVGCALQFQLDALGIVLQHRVVEALAGQRVDVAEGVAEFVVEERTDHAFGQRRADVADLLAHLVPEVGDFAANASSRAR